MEIVWKPKCVLHSVRNNSAVKLGVWIVTEHCDSDKCMAPGHIAAVPSMASLATVDTSSSVYAPTQLLNWVYLTLADQNSAPTTDQVPVSSIQTIMFRSCSFEQFYQDISCCWQLKTVY